MRVSRVKRVPLELLEARLLVNRELCRLWWREIAAIDRELSAARGRPCVLASNADVPFDEGLGDV